MNELHQLGDLLAAKYGWMSAIMGWMAAARLPLKFIQDFLRTKLTAGLTAVVDKVRATPQKEDDEFLTRVFESRPYRWGAFLLDLLLSIKLPDATSLQEHLDQPPKP